MTTIDSDAVRVTMDQTRRKRLRATLSDLAELDGELVLAAAAMLEPYERLRLAVLFDVAADQ